MKHALVAFALLLASAGIACAQTNLVGPVRTYSCASHTWANSLAASTGATTCTQPAYPDISGVATAFADLANLSTLSTAYKTQPIFGPWPGLSAQASALIENGRALSGTFKTPLTSGSGTALVFLAPASIVVCTTTCTITPPVPAAGYQFCAMNGDNVSTIITLAALGSSARYETTARTGYGTAGTGTFTSAGAVGDEVCILGLDATHYLTMPGYVGTWTAS